LDSSYAWTAAMLGQQLCLDSSYAWTAAMLGQQLYLDSSYAWIEAMLQQQLCSDSSYAAKILQKCYPMATRRRLPAVEHSLKKF
jgi:hypothetical protein